MSVDTMDLMGLLSEREVARLETQAARDIERIEHGTQEMQPWSLRELETLRRELNEEQDIAQSPELQAIERELCKRDGLYWLYRWVWTLDSHETNEHIGVIKRFPRKDYIERLWDTIESPEHHIILIPKSRQMMITWICVANCLWRAQFFAGQMIAMQSMKMLMAEANLSRLKFIYRKQPRWLRQVAKENEGKLEFPKIHSIIRAMPQGEDQMRTFTATRWFCDEAAFQPLFRKAYDGARPTLGAGKGKAIIVSSAKIGAFWDMVEERVE